MEWKAKSQLDMNLAKWMFVTQGGLSNTKTRCHQVPPPSHLQPHQTPKDPLASPPITPRSARQLQIHERHAIDSIANHQKPVERVTKHRPTDSDASTPDSPLPV
ncbi:hypothetical protein IG631_19668 [Alternaria alternata]|nr:hypothetical protein IG631_19668 [Alternaria alternata]